MLHTRTSCNAGALVPCAWHRGRVPRVGAASGASDALHRRQVDADGNIVDSCFKTFGCGSAIASSSVATEWVKGRNLDGATSIKNSDIAKHLSLPPVKLHCSMLAEDAIKARRVVRACVRACGADALARGAALQAAVNDVKAKRAAAAARAAGQQAASA